METHKEELRAKSVFFKTVEDISDDEGAGCVSQKVEKDVAAIRWKNGC